MRSGTRAPSWSCAFLFCTPSVSYGPPSISTLVPSALRPVPVGLAVSCGESADLMWRTLACCITVQSETGELYPCTASTVGASLTLLSEVDGVLTSVSWWPPLRYPTARWSSPDAEATGASTVTPVSGGGGVSTCARRDHRLHHRDSLWRLGFFDGESSIESGDSGRVGSGELGGQSGGSHTSNRCTRILTSYLRMLRVG